MRITKARPESIDRAIRALEFDIERFRRNADVRATILRYCNTNTTEWLAEAENRLAILRAQRGSE